MPIVRVDNKGKNKKLWNRIAAGAVLAGTGTGLWMAWGGNAADGLALAVVTNSLAHAWHLVWGN